jgi:DNA-binding MarR family transcriptional regulator
MTRERTPIDELLELLPELAAALNTASAQREMHEAHPDLTLTARQVRAAMHLAQRGRITMGEFAKGLAVSRGTASEMAERLEEKGMVVREHDVGDRRLIWVSLSQHAGHYVAGMLASRRSQLQAAVNEYPDLPPERLAAFVTTLTERLQQAPQ